MMRHSLNYFLRQLAQERPMRYDNDKIGKALQFLNGDEFHRRLRIDLNLQFVKSLFYFERNIKRGSLGFPGFFYLNDNRQKETNLL